MNTASTQMLPSTGPALLWNVSSVLAGIVLLILVLAWLVRRLGLTSRLGKAQSYLTVRASCSLGQRERVAIIEVDNIWLVVGITPNQITHLHTCNVQKIEPATEPPTTDFQQLLQNLLKTTWKR